jgi:topoisomerase-4 subunit A
MKAMGNRLSQLPIKSVELIVTEDVAEEAIEEEADSEAEELDEAAAEADETETENEPVKPEAPAMKSAPKQVDPPKDESPKTESEKSPEHEVREASNESSDSPPKPAQTQTKKIDFEITNPDDIYIDDKGQLGLF